MHTSTYIPMYLTSLFIHILKRCKNYQLPYLFFFLAQQNLIGMAVK